MASKKLSAEELIAQAWEQRARAIERGILLTELRVHPEDYYTLMAWKPEVGRGAYFNSPFSPDASRLFDIPLVVTTEIDPLSCADTPWWMKHVESVRFFKEDETP